MPEAITFQGLTTPAGRRAERKMWRAARFLSLPMGSRRWRRWNRVADRNVGRLKRAVALELRAPSSFASSGGHSHD